MRSVTEHFTVSNSSCGKVMFFVCDSVHGMILWHGACIAGHMCGRGAGQGRGHAWQGVCVIGGMHGRTSMEGEHAWQGACVAGGGMHSRGACMAGETATAADDTHPIGMHSCFFVWWLAEFHLFPTICFPLGT